MARVQFKPNAFYELRRSPGVVAELESRARRILAAAGGEEAGYVMSSQQGARRPQGRWRTTVAAKSRKAKRQNAKNNTLLHALDAGR